MHDEVRAVTEMLDGMEVSAELRDHLLKAARTGAGSERHHVVPIAYLKAWTGDDGLVHAWNTATGNVFRTAPRNVCVETDAYTTRLLDGTPTALLEGLLAPLDERFAHLLVAIREGHHLPPDPHERIGLAFAIALQQMRLPQMRRIASDLADTVARTQLSDEMVTRGLDPFGFRMEQTAEGHARMMLESAMILAPLLAMRPWRLHVATRDWFATGDMPVLYDYTAMPDPDVVHALPDGGRLLAETHAAGLELRDLSSSVATARQVLFPIAPDLLLEIAPGLGDTTETVRATGPIRDEHERLLIRCRELMIVARPGNDILERAAGTQVPRRRQIRAECVQTIERYDGGECTLRYAHTYAVEPELHHCGNHL